MGKRRCPFLSAVAVGCALMVASPTWAATVEPGFGDLTINHGQGFKPVTSRINANVGDAVMVGPGGSATVVYEDGCKVDIRPGAVTTIAPLSPCASGSNAQTAPDCKQWPDGQWYSIDPHGGHHPCEPPNDWVGAGIGIGLLGIGLGVGIYEATKGNGTTTAVQQPASP
jgi:hypothetical protein